MKKRSLQDLEKIAQYGVESGFAEISTSDLVDSDTVRVSRKMMINFGYNMNIIPDLSLIEDIIRFYETAKRVIELYEK
ncbi:hypothetical protein JYT44_03205 [Caldithrix abyssi]|nr:hypothetical protein [Caldithrix abyssi]